MAKLLQQATTGGTLREFPISPSLKIGRDKTNLVSILEDTHASREHTYIYIVNDGPRPSFFVRDLGSRNGTFVNEQKINEPRRLQDGDRIRAGRSEFVFRLEPGEGVMTAAASPSSTRRVVAGAAYHGVYAAAMWLLLLAFFGGAAFGSRLVFAHLIGRMFAS